jgi:sulfate transport system permease protein
MTPGPALTRSAGAPRRAAADSSITRVILITVSLIFLTLFLFLPVLTVFIEALRDGLGAYVAAITDESTLAAVRLTMLTTAIAVPLNVVFGLAAAWAITRFEFRLKSLLITLIDLPFAVSPVISGMLYVLLFGAQGLLGPTLQAHDIHIIFAVPGIVLATTFVTFPFVARELIPFMQSQGIEEDQAALVLGASGFQTFTRVTCPTSSGGCSTAWCSARRGPWGSSARCRWFQGTFAGRPTPCRSIWRYSTTITTSSAPSRWPRCWRASPSSPSSSRACWNGGTATRSRQRDTEASHEKVGTGFS